MRSFFHRKASPTLLRDPLQAPVPELRDAEIAAVYYAQRMGGDFYDFLRVSPDRVLFGLLDAAGGRKDTRAILSAVQHTFRTVGAELLAQQEINEPEAMIELCHQLNRTVLQAAAGVHSCPAFAGCYNENLGIVCYFNAGHTAGLLRDHANVTPLPATTLPLGLFSHATSDAPMVALEPGAALLLASRGIVEARCQDEEFGLERVSDTLQRAAGESAKALCATVLDKVQEFMCRPPTDNDVTALALARATTATS
jgi:sigma-B regulation protein RsbU (phosphoserine phosphatase)